LKKLVKPIEKFNKIIAPVDFSDRSKKALTYAKVLCHEYDVALEILHVVENRIHPTLNSTGKSSVFDSMPDIKEKSSKLINDILKKLPGPDVPVTINITEGIAVREILKYAAMNHIDLIIISTHGKSGLNYFLLGSVANKIVSRSTCPVYIV